MSPLVLQGLLKKKAELLAAFKKLEKDLASIKADIKSINQVILILDPTHPLKPLRAKRFNAGFFKGGELRDLLLEILHEDFLSTDAILQQIKELKHFQFSNHLTPQALRSRVLTALHYHTDKGLFVREHQGKKEYCWRLAGAEELLESIASRSSS